MDSTGAWTQLTVPEGQIAVLAGYTMEQATCGLITAAKHRMVCFNASIQWKRYIPPPQCIIAMLQHKAFCSPLQLQCQAQMHTTC